MANIIITSTIIVITGRDDLYGAAVQLPSPCALQFPLSPHRKSSSSPVTYHRLCRALLTTTKIIRATLISVLLNFLSSLNSSPAQKLAHPLITYVALHASDFPPSHLPNPQYLCFNNLPGKSIGAKIDLLNTPKKRKIAFNQVCRPNKTAFSYRAKTPQAILLSSEK